MDLIFEFSFAGIIFPTVLLSTVYNFTSMRDERDLKVFILEDFLFSKTTNNLNQTIFKGKIWGVL